MSIGKYKTTRRIDRQPRQPHASSGAAGDGGGVTAPPAPPALPAPTGLVLSAALSFSAVTPAAKITATWTGLESYDLETYQLQLDTSSSFTNPETFGTAPNQTSAIIDNRRVSTTYYARVRTVVMDTPSPWSDTANVTTGSDTTTPAVPTSPAASFINAGDLVVTWVNSVSSNYRDTEIKIYASNGGALYGTFYDATGRFVWTAAANLAATSGAGDPTLYVELRSRSWGAVLSAAVNASATKSAPATPSSVVHTWSSDPGTAGSDWTIAWALPTDASAWRLSINSGTAKALTATSYTYPYALNVAENGTADPTLSYSLWAVDALGQTSGVVIGTATNAAPATTAITAVGAVNAISVALTASTAADLQHYSLRIVKDGVTQATLTTRATTAMLDVAPYSSGAYQIGVSVVDMFGQSSTETLSSSSYLEPFNLTTFRGGARYVDSNATASATLDALKDTIRASGGVNYS